MLTETEAIRSLLEQGNIAGALAILDSATNQQPQSTIKQALNVIAESKNQLSNQLKSK